MCIERVILTAWNFREAVQGCMWTTLVPGGSGAFIIEHLLHGHVLHGKSQLHRQGITEQLIKCHYLSVHGSALPANRFTHTLIVLVDLIVSMTNFVFIQC